MKAMYFLASDARRPEASLLATALAGAASIRALDGVTAVKIAVTDRRPPRGILPLRDRAAVLVSVWGPACTSPAVATAARSLGRAVLGEDATTLGVQVDESMPVAYERTWPDGEPSPGAQMLTLLRKNPTIDREAFLAEWFGKHTPMAVAIHPLWSYVRNVVVGAVDGEDAGRLDGLVEEHVREEADLTRPWRFFGSVLGMIPNMIRVGLHVRKFLDLAKTENYFLREVWVRSRPDGDP